MVKSLETPLVDSEILDLILKSKDIIIRRNPNKPKIPHQDKLLQQRHEQRNILFKYCLWIIGILLALMFIILFLQIAYKWNSGTESIKV